MTLSIVLIAILALALNGVSNGYVRFQEKTVCDREAELALETIITDLECMVIPKHRTSDGLPVESLRVSKYEADQVSSSWLTLISRTNDEEPRLGDGLVRAISYRIEHQDPIEGAEGNSQPVYALYRKVLPASDTFENAISNHATVNEVWQNQAIVDDISPPEAWLAANVVNLQVRFLTESPASRIPADPEDELVIRSGETVIFRGDTEIPQREPIIAAEVALTIVSKVGAEALADGASLDSIVKRYGYLYSRQTAIFPQTF